MAYPTDRVMLYDKDGNGLGDLAPSEVYGRLRVEQINDEHELTLTTTRILTVGTRILTWDGTGKIREHVVYRPNERHATGEAAMGTYRCMWSLQYDLMGVYAEKAEPGMGTACSASSAVACAIDGTDRWEVGTVDVGGVAAGKGCVMIGISGWERLSLVVKHWGGEVDAEITVSATGVVSRRVALRAHLGSTTARRRFDWGADLTEIDRCADDGPYYCRVVPLGRGQQEYAEDDTTPFEWPLDISEETGGRVYIEDYEAARVFRTRNPDGTYDYPTKVVHYDESDPELLLDAALEDLPNHTHPKVRYEANVLQFAEAGMDAQGVELGDETQCADWGFNAEHPLHISARVTRMEVNELSPRTDTKLTLGDVGDSLSDALMQLVGTSTRELTTKVSRIEGGGTIVYLDGLLDAVNAEINATGGYSYLVAGQGLVTYDRAVANPLVASEASMVTQVKGGSLRFAKSRPAAFSGIDDWDWTTVITPDGYLGLAATIAKITAGYIKDPDENLVIDLDDGVMTFKKGTIQTSDNHTRWDLTSTFTRTIDGTSRSGLRLAIGSTDTTANFAVTSGGKLYATDAEIAGKIVATSGEVGGLTISGSAIYSGTAVTSNADNAVALSSADFARTINSVQRSGLRFAIGDKLGVTGDGKLYASDVTVSGTIAGSTITGPTITGGTITGTTVKSEYGNKYVQISNGEISVGYNSITYGSIYQMNDGIYISRTQSSRNCSLAVDGSSASMHSFAGSVDVNSLGVVLMGNLYVQDVGDTESRVAGMTGTIGAGTTIHVKNGLIYRVS